MAVACIILVVIAVLGIGLAFYYRRQIKNVKNQISFLNQHETNMLITSDQKSGCVAELTDELNTLIEQTAALRKEIADNESHLKDTIINLSHDIRTPLTSMDGYFQLLLKSDDPEERQQYAAVISDRLFSLKEMLDELFTYAKLTNKAYEIELSPCAVNEILLSVLFSFYKDIKQKAIEPFIDVPEQDVFIQGNEPALRRIFQNILKNCIEHGNRQRACGRRFCQPAATGTKHFDPVLRTGYGRRRDRQPHRDVPQRRPAPQDKDTERVACKIDGAHAGRRLTRMKEPAYKGKEPLPLSVYVSARAGDPQAVERLLRYYDNYMNCLCTRTLYDEDGYPRLCVDEYMKRCLEIRLIQAIVKV